MDFSTAKLLSRMIMQTNMHLKQESPPYFSHNVTAVIVERMDSIIAYAWQNTDFAAS